jgi:hypothetical protein
MRIKMFREIFDVDNQSQHTFNNLIWGVFTVGMLVGVLITCTLVLLTFPKGG